MKREQIIEILKNPHWFLNGKLFESDFERIANAILALPLDVPSDADIVKYAFNCYPDSYNMRVACVNGANAMRDGKITPVSRDNDR